MGRGTSQHWWHEPEEQTVRRPDRQTGLWSGAIGTRPAWLAPCRWRVKAIDLASIIRFQSTRLAILALNGVVHLLTVYGDLDRGRDPQSNLITANIHNGNDDIITNYDTFVAVSGQDQHR